MREKAGLLVVPMFAVLAAIVGWFVLGGVDTGPEVADAPTVRLPTPVAAAPSEEPSEPEVVEEPAPERPIESEPAVVPSPAPEGLGSSPHWPTDTRPGPPSILPAAAERMHDATVRATSRRVDMLQRMFDAASQAVRHEGDRERVAGVLDDALERMRRLEGRVDDGDLTYRDAVGEMDAIREDAAGRVAEILPADEAEAVKVRMGMRTPFTRRAAPAQWEGVPFEQEGGDW